MPMPKAGPPVAIRVDAFARSGVGHLVRMLALSEELLARGRPVLLYGATDLPWASGQIASRGLRLEVAEPDPAAFAGRLSASGVAVCVVDGYEFSDALGAALRASGVGVMAFCDGEFGLGQDADVYVDANLGAAPSPGKQVLAGVDFVLLRDVVLDRCGQVDVVGDGVPRVLVVFGGTDPHGGCVTASELVLATGLPVEVVAVAARPEIAAALDGLDTGPGQTVRIVPPADDLPGLAVTCQAAVSASGSSTWELACLGIPTALVCVVDNQRLGYHEATRSLCLPAGELNVLRHDEVARSASVGVLSRLLDVGVRRELAGRASELVDGLGRQRVADAIEALEGQR